MQRQRNASSRKAKAKPGFAKARQSKALLSTSKAKTDLFGGIGQTEFLADFSELYSLVDKQHQKKRNTLLDRIY